MVCFLIIVYTHPLNTEYTNHRARNALPNILIPPETLTLITEPEQGIQPVLDTIKSASKSLDLVMYEFKDREVADALIDASKRGVAVRVLMNQGYFGKQEDANVPAYAYLESHGISVHWSPAYFALTHQKTLIVDKNKALIMTFNFTPEYYVTERDFGVVDTDQNDVTAIENTFNADWNDTEIGAQNGDGLVWSPGSYNDMLLIINSAQKELDIYNEEMADERIVAALENAIKRGVFVRIVMTYQSADKNELIELKNAGAVLHLFHGEKGTYIHAKMIVSDQDYAFLGSENFSFGSLDQNRELGIFLSDRAIITSLMQTFETDWKNAEPF